MAGLNELDGQVGRPGLSQSCGGAIRFVHVRVDEAHGGVAAGPPMVVTRRVITFTRVLMLMGNQSVLARLAVDATSHLVAAMTKCCIWGEPPKSPKRTPPASCSNRPTSPPAF